MGFLKASRTHNSSSACPHAQILVPRVCTLVLFIYKTVIVVVSRELSRLADQLPDTEKSRATQSGINLFYEILRSLSPDCRQFPPSAQFLTSCIQILGQVQLSAPKHKFSCASRGALIYALP